MQEKEPLQDADPGTREFQTRAHKVPGGPASYTFLLPPIQDDEIGRLGNYRVLRLLGVGGMGMVFHAEDIALHRPVALKIMRTDREDVDKTLFGKRFLREARAMASIKHDHLVTVYQAGQEGETLYLAMEFLQGETLENWILGTEQVDIAEVIRIGKEIANGLAAIHQNGLIHRDIKPANIWLEQPQGRVKILDFGLARATNEDLHLTKTGMIVGTPAYLSPEQARGKTADARSDLFSFGCVLYRMCTKNVPFNAESTLSQLAALVADNPTPVREVNPNIPEPLADLVMELLAKNPDERPPTATIVAERLTKIKRLFSKGKTEAFSKTQTLQKTQAVQKVDTPRQAAASRKEGIQKGESASRSEPSQKSSRRKLGKSQPITKIPFWQQPWGLAVLGGSASLLLGLVVSMVLVFNSIADRPDIDKQAFAKDKSPPDKSGAEKKGPEKKEPSLIPGNGQIQPQDKVFLTDLKPQKAVNWPFSKFKDKKGKKGPPKELFDRVTVQGEESPHGIFMHPTPDFEDPASLSYQLDRKYQTFHARVTLNDSSPHSMSPMIFSVYGDDKLLWKSKPIIEQDQTQIAMVPLKNVTTLKLEVTAEGDIGGAHGVWIEPFLTKGP